MKSPSWSNAALAGRVRALGAAFGRLVGPAASPASHAPSGWTEQFSRYSHDQRIARCRVHALYRGATARL